MIVKAQTKATTEQTPRDSRGLFFYAVLILAVDFLVISVSFLLPWFFRIGVYSEPFSFQYFLAILLFHVAYFTLAFSDGSYKETAFKSAQFSFFNASKNVLLTFGVLLLLAFAFKVTANFSRIWAMSWGGILLSYMLVSRFVAARVVRKLAGQGIVASRAIIIGSSKDVQRMSRNAAAIKDEIKVVGYILDEDSGVDKSKLSRENLCFLGGLDQLERKIDEHRIDDIIIALPWSEASRIQEIVSRVSRRSVNVYLVPANEVPIKNTGQHRIVGGLSLITVDVKPIDRWWAFVKRLEDLVLSLFILILMSPLMILVALIIKVESKGPVFFSQARYGFNNELFQILKFRSMYTDFTDEKADQQTVVNDPRVTRVGRIIRKTSIDELPQLFNVLRGNMSLVGPRPHAEKNQSGWTVV